MLVLGACVVGVFSVTDLVVGKVSVKDGGGYSFQFGPLVALYALIIVGLLVIIIRNLIGTARNGSPRERQQAYLLLMGFCSTTFLGLITNIVVPYFVHSWEAAPFSPALSLLLVASITYAMLKHGLFDFRSFVIRSIGYSITLLFFSATYGVIVFGVVKGVLHQELSTLAQVVLSVITALASFGFPLIRKIFDKLTGRLFRKYLYDPQDLLDELNDRIVGEVDIAKICKTVIDVLMGHLRVERISLQLTSSHVHFSSDNKGDRQALEKINALLINNRDVVLSLDRIAGAQSLHSLAESLRAANVTAVAELRDRKSLLARMYLAPKLSGLAFNTQDLRIIKIAADQAALAIQNAMRFEEIANFNKTLQKKVDEVSGEYEAINKQMYAQNYDLARVNKTLTALRTIDLIILQSRATFAGLSEEVSAAIVQASPYAFVGILSLSRPSNDYLDFQGWSVSQDRQALPVLDAVQRQLSSLTLPLSGEWVASASESLTINLNTMETSAPMRLPSKAQAVLQDFRRQMNVQSLHVVRLRARNSLVGLMVVGLNEDGPKESDIEFITRLSEPVGVAIDNKLLLDENAHVLRRLSLANEKLQKLDESKDEFISMASHQLRTPLTSIKGYVSMVLDGDAGDISEPQRKMLAQAYTSTQRMVFLIADLLNVSRLRTGKFVIDRKPIQLTQVIKSEVQQLQDTAAARDLTLVTNLPDDFPLLMLDETKTRQVLMNFIDNAIYYTPAGGTITVTLSATSRSVELSVNDTGIGVVRAEQHNLFSKYFRAENARKARPDGTGLGLFMAKKVIIAQGGAILFKSKEGKGSTFGFTFPLASTRATKADLEAAKHPSAAKAA